MITHSDDIGMSLTGNCNLCHELFERAQKITDWNCNHKYHIECIQPWLTEHNTCPMCASDARTGRSTESQSDQNTTEVSIAEARAYKPISPTEPDILEKLDRDIINCFRKAIAFVRKFIS